MANRARRLIEFYYEFTGGSNDARPKGCGQPKESETTLAPATSLDALDPLFNKTDAPEPSYDPDAIGEQSDDGKACCTKCAVTGGCCQDDEQAEEEAEDENKQV